MKMVESEFEVFNISKTVSLYFQGFDFVIQIFDFGGSYFMVEIVQNSA